MRPLLGDDGCFHGGLTIARLVRLIILYARRW